MAFFNHASYQESIDFSISLGISKLCVSSLESLCGNMSDGNCILFETIAEFPDNLYGYVVYNPRHPDQSIMEIDKYIGHSNFAGVKIHPREHDYSLSGERYIPLWEYAAKQNLVILCHTWETESFNDPLLFFPILEKFHGLNVLLGHSGGTWKGYETCYKLLREYPGTYMDVNGFLYSSKWIEQVVEETDINRILFSTDQVFNDPRIPLGRIVLSSLTDEQKSKILYQNYDAMMKRILK